jgi:DNA (cytosine-5)-methyltransferase 1
LYIPEYTQIKRKWPIAMDFFAGCGGFSLGFMKAGFEVVAANEWEPNATITYLVNLGSYPVNIHYIGSGDKERLNKQLENQIKREDREEKKDPSGKGNLKKWDTKYGIYNTAIGSKLSGSGWIRHNPSIPPVRNFWFGDIRKLKGQDMLDKLGLRQGDVDCVCGGPPCQGYSILNSKRNVMDPRNSLVFEYARMITEIQPKTFVMEEVPNILNMETPEGFPVIDELARILEDGGFGTMDALKKMLLNTSGCGAALKGKPKEKKEATRKPSHGEIDGYEQMSML